MVKFITNPPNGISVTISYGSGKRTFVKDQIVENDFVCRLYPNIFKEIKEEDIVKVIETPDVEIPYMEVTYDMAKPEEDVTVEYEIKKSRKKKEIDDVGTETLL